MDHPQAYRSFRVLGECEKDKCERLKDNMPCPCERLKDNMPCPSWMLANNSYLQRHQLPKFKINVENVFVRVVLPVALITSGWSDVCLEIILELTPRALEN